MAAEWYCKIAGAELGPLSAQQLKALAADGRLRPSDEVRQGSDGKWVPASRVKGLLGSAAGGTLAARPLGGEGASPRKPAQAPPRPVVPTPILQAQAAPKPPGIPPTAIPVAQRASEKSISPKDVGTPSPFIFTDPDADGGKSTGTSTGRFHSLSPADLAERRRRQRMRLLAGSLGILGGAVVIGTVLWLTDPFGAESEKPAVGKREAGQPVEEDLAGDLNEGIEDVEAIIDGRVSKPEALADTTAADSEERHAVGDTATVGPVGVRVVAVEVGKPRIVRADGRPGTPRDDYLIIHLELTNNDPTKRIAYSGWGGRVPRAQRGILVDNHNNSYELKTFPQGPIEGQQTRTSLYPGEPMADLLVFERPVPAAEFLRLELPAAAFGETGAIRFTIPKQRIGAPPAEHVAAAAHATASDPDFEPAGEDPLGETDDEVYQLEVIERAGRPGDDEPGRPLTSREKLMLEYPELFPPD